jgi:hypothetical protein
MILNDNIATQIGDCIYFQTVPMLNMQTVTAYSDSVTGEIGTSRYFDREFQYSLDGGITFSGWANLNGSNSTNITQINLLLTSNFHQLVILFKFTRVGTDNTGQLQINSISINGTNVDRGSVFLVSGKSIFKDTVFNNINVLNLMINLSAKMYELGIVPAYLTRKEEESGFMSDEAYIDFWQTIAYFYSVLTIDSIKFENVYWRRPLLCEFLNEKNIFLCDCTDMVQMQLIAQNFYTEIRVRGTEEIFKSKGYEYNVGYRNSYNLPTSYVIQPSSGVQIDGIIYKEIYTLPFGWTVQGTALVAADKNYHQVLFFDGQGFTIPPAGKSIIFPTIESKILKQYNGEYLRLICFNNQCDEFIFSNVSDIFIGWCMGHASPLYRGLRPQLSTSLIKAYEKQENVQDLNKYPLINSANIYIGIANNPNGVSDTVMYISSDGSPCLAAVIPLLTNVSKHLNVNISSSTISVDGLIKLTNLLTLDEFDIPITTNGIATFSINTDLTPARYSVELIFTHTGTMVSSVNDGAALEYDFVDVTGTMDQLYSLTNVGSDIININVNFS